jgi:hypothetical protein
MHPRYHRPGGWGGSRWPRSSARSGPTGAGSYARSWRTSQVGLANARVRRLVLGEGSLHLRQQVPLQEPRDFGAPGVHHPVKPKSRSGWSSGNSSFSRVFSFSYFWVIAFASGLQPVGNRARQELVQRDSIPAHVPHRAEDAADRVRDRREDADQRVPERGPSRLDGRDRREEDLLHALLGLRTDRDLLSHPKAGASWEGFAVDETLKAVRPDGAYFWAKHTGAELDLLVFRGRLRFGVELKFQDAPRLTPSMRVALEDLKLDHLAVLYPGNVRYTLHERVTVVRLSALAEGDATRLFPLRARPRRGRNRRQLRSRKA